MESERVAVLRKLREHLLSQKKKFQDYLALIELEEIDIEQGDVVKLRIHTEMENDILSGITAIQKVIDPLEDLYRVLKPGSGTAVEEGEVRAVRDSLNGLRAEVQKRNRRNRQLLSERMQELKAEILSIRRPVFAQKQFAETAPSLIDIST